jgi:hypothetical protein
LDRVGLLSDNGKQTLHWFSEISGSGQPGPDSEE